MNQLTNTLDIVGLIEKNPITRLKGEYNNRFIEKIQTTFTDAQQKMFVSSFYCYLNCDDGAFKKSV